MWDWILERTSLVRGLRSQIATLRQMSSALEAELQAARHAKHVLQVSERDLKKDRDEWKSEAESLQKGIRNIARAAEAYEVARQEDAPPF